MTMQAKRRLQWYNSSTGLKIVHSVSDKNFNLKDSNNDINDNVNGNRKR